MKRLAFASLSIRKRLPLLICILLLFVILSFGLLAYWGVRAASLKAGEDRLQSLSQQFGTMLSGNTHSLIATTYAAANKPSVKAYLATKDSTEEVKKLLQDLQKDSSYVRTELLDPDRHEILAVSKGIVNINIPPDSFLLSASGSKIDSGRVGKIYLIGDSMYYPVYSTIVENDKLSGYLIRWRRVVARSKTVDQISQLMGASAKLYIGNADGSLWTDMITPVSVPPLKQKRNQIIEFTRSNTTVLASIHPIAKSGWLVSIEFPKDKILQTAQTFLYWLILIGLSLLIIGTFCGWLMSRSISNPLAKLTIATSQIAAGKFSSPVLVNRHDELGKLAESFNAMAAQVQDSQEKLEQKAEKYRLLFEYNPMPMWISLESTKEIADVNKAAINHYGFTKEEFLKLNSTDLRPQEDVKKYMQFLNKHSERNRPGIWRHKKKDGTIIMVEVIADNILYKGEEARLELANDVTEKLKAEAELVRQRVMQQELITETTILVQEKERDELGKELHDNINQILAATKLYLELAKSDDKDLFPEAIPRSYENINLAMVEIRRLSKQLVPPALDTSLGDTLQDLVHEIEAITPITICFDQENYEESYLNENIKLMIYRIVQEQVNNILKYAAASKVEITLRANSESVHLKILDNGVGFDTTVKSKGIGLRNIDNRVKFQKGKATIISSPGEGCSLEVSIPLQNEIKIAI
jgi:PAS domain S-box-containing protein